MKNMTLPKRGSSLYFIGIGGISMSSLAMLAHHMGYRVAGSDIGSNAQIDAMKQSGICVYPQHDPAQLGDARTVIYTAAVSEHNPELHAARQNGLTCMTRAAFLGLLMREYTVRIGVSGTHGKSTTTGMISEIYIAAQADPTIVSGAVMPKTGLAYRIGARDAFLFEACEYTDSFLSFFPTTVVVLNVELDHVDYFASMEQLRTSFVRFMNLSQTAVINGDDAELQTVCQRDDLTCRVIRFGIKDEACDARATNISFDGGFASFDFTYRGDFICRIHLCVPGEHNVYDALAAATAAYCNGVGADAIAAGLNAFTGAARRFECKGKLPCGARVYDDYAHHPSEIRATLAAARGMGGRVRCVFQPHSYSRTVALFDDFAHAFSDADEVIFADIYINLEQERTQHELTSADLSAAVPGSRYMPDMRQIAAYLEQTAQEKDIILLMGAGSIYHVRDFLPLQGEMTD